MDEQKDGLNYLVSKDDKIWNCGEGINDSVYSRFKSINEGVAAFSNHGGKTGSGVSSFMQQGK